MEGGQQSKIDMLFAQGASNLVKIGTVSTPARFLSGAIKCKTVNAKHEAFQASVNSSLQLVLYQAEVSNCEAHLPRGSQEC